MVTVRDQRLSSGQVTVDRPLVVRCGDSPQPVPSAVGGMGLDGRWPGQRGVDDLAGRPVAVIGQQDRLELCRRGRHQRGTVGDRAGEHVLVREDPALDIVMQRHRTHQAHRSLFAYLKLVDVERRLGVLYQQSIGDPLPQTARCVRVPVGCCGAVAGEDEPDDVVRVCGLPSIDPVSADDVVRGAGDRAEVWYRRGVVTECPERGQSQWPCAVVGGAPGFAAHLIRHGTHRRIRSRQAERVGAKPPAEADRMVIMATLADTYDVALLDLDGVVYVGAHAVPHAAEALTAVRRKGMRLAYVTNNAARPPRVVAEHLTSLGVDAGPDEVVTSAQAAARMLAEMLPARAKVLVVGGDGLVEALAEQNLVAVAELGHEPAAVVQGFHPDVGWRLLAEGAYAVANGLPWVASNVDRTIPTPRGRAPGNGTLVEVLRMTTGRTPVVAGKPEPPMHREAVLRSAAQHPIVVGDRLDTDIEGAYRAGADSLLVLTGVTDPAELAVAPIEHRPTFVGEDLRALLATPDDMVVTPGTTSAGGWSAGVEGGRITLTEIDGARPTRLDALRAVCGLTWAAEHPLDGLTDVLGKAGW